MNKRSLQLFRLLPVALLAFSFVLLSSSPVLGNMADPYRYGDPIGEPSPLLDSIHVLNEQLRIDLRPLSLAREDQPAYVEAVYHLRNDGGAKSLDLVFIAAGLYDSAGTFRVMLDGRPVAGRYHASLSVPAEWRLPPVMPGLGGIDSFPYVIRFHGRAVLSGEEKNPTFRADSTPTILFTLVLPPGEHRVTVSYQAKPAGYPGAGDVYVWQLGYVLAPARRWGSFGRLDAQIVVPKDWDVAVTPAMQRNGDTLSGSWNGIPADAIAISTRKHISVAEYRIAQYLPLVLSVLLFGLLTFRMGWRKGIKLAEEGKGLTGAIGLSVLCSMLSYMMLGAGVVAGDIWADNVLGNQEIPNYGFLETIAVMIFSLPLLLIPSPIALIAAAIAKSRASRIGSAQGTPPEPMSTI